jgi:hypothetical protein
VQYFLQTHPDVAKQHCIIKKEAGSYEIDMHEVRLEWQHASEVGKPGHLVVVDGPLRQPFADYLAMNETNAMYDTNSVARTSSLHHVPKEKRMTFDDTNKKYSRLEAMRVAKEQAKIREQAADYIKDGREVPEELVKKYNKALQRKARSGKSKAKDFSKQDEEKAEGSGEQPKGLASTRGRGGHAEASEAQPCTSATSKEKPPEVAQSKESKPVVPCGGSIDAPAQKASADQGGGCTTPKAHPHVTHRCSSVHGLPMGVVPLMPGHVSGFQGFNRTCSVASMTPVSLLPSTPVATCSVGKPAQQLTGSGQARNSQVPMMSPRSPMLSTRIACQPMRTTGSYFPAALPANADSDRTSYQPVLECRR